MNKSQFLKVGAKKKCSVDQVVETYQRLQDIELTAQALEVSTFTVRGRLKDAGIKPKDRRKKNGYKAVKFDPQQAISLHKQRYSLRAIAQKLGVSHQAIADCLKAQATSEQTPVSSEVAPSYLRAIHRGRSTDPRNS